MTTQPQDDDDDAAIYASPKLTDEQKQLWRDGREDRERLRQAAESGACATSNWVLLVASLHEGLPELHSEDDLSRLNQLVRHVTCERTGFPLEEWPNLNEAEREYWMGEALKWKPDEPEPFAPAPLMPPEPQPQLHPVEPTADDAPQYVTRDQIAALVQRHKDTVADWFNRDDKAPQAAVEGGGGERYEYVWSEVRPWLEAKTGRKLPARFPGAP